MHRLGCLKSGDALVIVSGNSPPALDGYDFEICTAKTSAPRCGKYNRATIDRPVSLAVSLTDGTARVDQVGGSIFDYPTDPSGMKDPAYEHAVPLEVTFLTRTNKEAVSPSYHVEGKLAQLVSCPKS